MNIKKDEYRTNVQLKKKIGAFIKKLRLSTSLTGKELGKILKVSQQQISRYENGVTEISIEKLDIILHQLGSSWGDFYIDVLSVNESKNKSSDYYNSQIIIS